MLNLEMKIIQCIDFQMPTASPYRFLQRYMKVAKADTIVFFLAQFFLEVSMFDSKMS